MVHANKTKEICLKNERQPFRRHSSEGLFNVWAILIPLTQSYTINVQTSYRDIEGNFCC